MFCLFNFQGSVTRAPKYSSISKNHRCFTAIFVHWSSVQSVVLYCWCICD